MALTSQDISDAVASAQAAVGDDWFVYAQLGSHWIGQSTERENVTDELVFEAELKGTAPALKIQASTEAHLVTLAEAAVA